MNEQARIFVAGHRGMVGSAILRRLQSAGYNNILARNRAELDLTDQRAVAAFFEETRPTHVFVAAAKVGGIVANDTYPADFIRENLLIETAIIDAAHRYGVDRLLFLASSCVYPRNAPQPIKEEYLLSGPLESTNEAYAIAKIAGIKLCHAYNRQFGRDFRVAMPTNLYGPNDNYDRQTSHVLPALIRKIHDAKTANSSSVVVWGTGQPRREFLHVDDMADACIVLMQQPAAPDLVNIGFGKDIAIAELADMIASVIGYHGSVAFDATKPDGTPRKLLDNTRVASLGWTPRIHLRDGIAQTYADYLARHSLNAD